MPLRDYQKQAVQYIQDRKRAMLALDMGLGKTYISLAALTPEQLPVLVCAPQRVAKLVWPVEHRKYRPDLSLVVAAGTPAARRKALAAGADITVISRDNLMDVLEGGYQYKTFILDEMSGFKNHSANRWKIAKRIAARSEYVWGLTGTPMPNSELELWPQVYLLDGGERLGKFFTHFRNRYFYSKASLPNGTRIKWTPFPETKAAIHDLVQDICLYMDSADKLVDLPEVVVNDVEVPLTPAARLVYKTMKKDFVVNLDLLFGEGEKHAALDVGAMSAKLEQIAAGFLYVDDADLHGGKYDLIHLEKVRTAREIVDGTGSPVIITYWYKAELELLKQEFKGQAYTLDEPDFQEKWDRGEIPVLLMQPASGGHGLNLQYGGHTMIWMTLPWSLELYQQMNKRVHRPGQEHPVIIHRLIAPYTVDEAKDQRLEGKKDAQQAFLDHIRSPL